MRALCAAARRVQPGFGGGARIAWRLPKMQRDRSRSVRAPPRSWRMRLRSNLDHDVQCQLFLENRVSASSVRNRAVDLPSSGIRPAMLLTDNRVASLIRTCSVLQIWKCRKCSASARCRRSRGRYWQDWSECGRRRDDRIHGPFPDRQRARCTPRSSYSPGVRSDDSEVLQCGSDRVVVRSQQLFTQGERALEQIFGTSVVLLRR